MAGGPGPISAPPNQSQIAESTPDSRLGESGFRQKERFSCAITLARRSVRLSPAEPAGASFITDLRDLSPCVETSRSAQLRQDLSISASSASRVHAGHSPRSETPPRRNETFNAPSLKRRPARSGSPAKEQRVRQRNTLSRSGARMECDQIAAR